MEAESTYLPIEGQTSNITTATASDDGDQAIWTPGNIVLSMVLFIIAGLLEVGGGYLMWTGLKEKKQPYLFIPVGAVVLILYGIVPTFQPTNNFGRVFAVYGGFFILLSYLWGYFVDGAPLDIGDYVGTAIALAGVCVAWFWPR